jgi:hypothetical protein
MKSRLPTTPAEPPELLRARLEAFVRGCREPAVLEPGERTIPLEPGRFELEIHGTAVVLHAWSEATNLVRRLLRVREERPGRLELAVQRLGRAEAVLWVLDLARAGAHFERQAERLEFRERFRRMLAREFGGWEVVQISAAADLEHTLSPAYTRALVTRGTSAFAAIGVDDDADAATCDHLLSFGLIWLDYLRTREKRRVVRGLKLFLPQKRSATTGHRLPFLDPARVEYALYEFASDNSTALLEGSNSGNLSTHLPPAPPLADLSPAVAAWIDRLARRFDLECVPRADGLLSLRVRGLEFARCSATLMTYGFDEDRPVTTATFSHVEDLAAELAQARSPQADDRQHTLYRTAPERWLESLVRAAPGVLDGNLRAEPIYSQVPAVAGVESGILDLLACDRSGRLAVLELKASEDIHLPLQGLDYWMRVKWHLDRGGFRARGYFPGVELQPAPPRLLLISPAFDFHPTTETILRYFSPQVEVERIGVGAEWRHGLQVVFRARGAERPG